MGPCDASEFDEHFGCFVAHAVGILSREDPSGGRELWPSARVEGVERVSQLHALFGEQQRPSIQDRPLRGKISVYFSTHHSIGFTDYKYCLPPTKTSQTFAQNCSLCALNTTGHRPMNLVALLQIVAKLFLQNYIEMHDINKIIKFI